MGKRKEKAECTQEFVPIQECSLEEQVESYREQLFLIRKEMAEREKDFEEFKQAFKVIIKNL